MSQSHINLESLRNYLTDKQEYIDILDNLIKYEENNKEPDHIWIKDTDYDSVWTHSDVGVHASKLYQLEARNAIERITDTNSTTAYVISDREKIKELVSSVKEEIKSSGGKKFAGEMQTVMHDFPKSESELPDSLFKEIIGFGDIKWLLKRGMTTDSITNFLLLGESGTAKTIFLLSIFDHMERADYVSAEAATSAGVLDKMFRDKPSYMLIDEFDDMKSKHQSVFASYTETGILDETKYGKDRKLKTNTKTLAAANDRSNIKSNILDRFNIIEFEPYSYEEFVEVCEHLLPMKEDKTEEEARLIAESVWDYKGEGDVRSAIQVSRLSRGDPEKVVGVLDEYSSSGLF